MTSSSILLSHPTSILKGTVQLPASKSESNRALIIQALSKEKITLNNLSDANDSILLQKLLLTPKAEINAEDAGTVMRFLTAYFCLTNQSKIITGLKRMQQRPIGILVDALRELGGEIEYLNEEGFPPLKITGFNPKKKGKIFLKMRGDVSSQFITAILLMAPVFQEGIEIELIGLVSSRPYLEMTLALMSYFGINTLFTTNKIVVEPSNYKSADFTVESDWSASGYWYSMTALAKEAEILLPGLKKDSLQGDRQVASLMEYFGVKTDYLPKGIRLTKIPATKEKISINFNQIPDLAQTFAVLAAAKNVPLEMTGLESLRIKETDRIAALQMELAKMGVKLEESEAGVFNITGNMHETKNIKITTYHDHRMAMSFAPIALLQDLEIKNPAVVKKSYPKFWQELEALKFEIKSNCF